MAVERSELITCLADARDYYRANLVGVRKVTCCGQKISIVFPFDSTHTYTIKAPVPIPDGAQIVTQRVAATRFEVRIFNLERAVLLDHILPAVSLFTVSIPGQGARGRENRVLHGRRLPTGDYMRVVLRPGPETAWTCVSAFPVAEQAWREAYRSRRAKFPP